MKIAGERFIPGQALTERQYNAVKLGKMAANKKYSDDVLRSYAAYENNGGGAEPEIVIVRSNTTTPLVVRQNQGGLLVLDEESSNTEESYASYQGH